MAAACAACSAHAACMAACVQRASRLTCVRCVLCGRRACACDDEAGIPLQGVAGHNGTTLGAVTRCWTRPSYTRLQGRLCIARPLLIPSASCEGYSYPMAWRGMARHGAASRVTLPPWPWPGLRTLPRSVSACTAPRTSSAL